MRFAILVFVMAGAPQGKPSQSSQRQNDPQAAIEPRSGPGIGHEHLKKFAGDWDVEKRLYLRGGEPIRSHGVCRQEMIHDGRFLRSEFVFERNGVRTTGTGVIGFDAATAKFTSFWTDSRSTGMSVRQSNAPFDGKRIALSGKGIGGEPAGRPSRTETTLDNGGMRIVHRQFVATADGKERVFMELIMTRKSNAH